MLGVTDLSPVNAFKLINVIYKTAHKAKVHRETCKDFASYLHVLSNLLYPIQNSEQVLANPAVQDALSMLHRTLVKALLLIQKCERTSTITAVVKHVPRDLKDLEGEIQKILSLLNLANLHVNLNITTNGSSAVLNKAQPVYPDVHGSAKFGESNSLQEHGETAEGLPARSLSTPSTSGQGLATSHSVSAKSLSITWGNDERYWKFVQREGSRSNEVAYLADVYWLEVRGQFNTGVLRPGLYTLMWRLQVACLDEDDEPTGWDSEPVVFKFSTSDGRHHITRSAYLVKKSFIDKKSSKERSSLDRSNSSPMDRQGSSKDGKRSSLEKSSSASSGFPDIDDTLEKLENGSKRGTSTSNPGWMELDVGSFTVDKKRGPLELTFSMSEVNGSWKRGLFLDAVLIKSCIDEQTEIVSDESGPSTKGGEGGYEVEDLPETFTFSVHPHELKLMTDPYWYACGECEATTNGVGYHCLECKYNVHPECCISGFHFATLLDLTDNEPSHWAWDTLLELNKHRLEEKTARPKNLMFPGHPHLLKLTLNEHPLFVCDAVSCEGHGWVFRGWDCYTYQCKECNFDLHPECRF